MRTIKSGSKGQLVQQMQQLLIDNGFSLTVDGKFGKTSEEAIKKFQFNHGLLSDGIVGNKTWEVLKASKPEITILRLGDEGDLVENLQKLLKEIGYKITPDGDFGKKTKKALKKFQHKVGLKSDGVAGPKTWLKLKERAAKQEQSTPEPSINVNISDETWLNKKTWDTHTNRRIKKLHPKVKSTFIAFINKAETTLGKQLRITSGLRTIKDQNKLFEQGRTRPGNIVTNARGGKSYHNFGLAVDIVEIKNGKALWNNPDWNEIAALGKSLGLEWGGDWVSIKDKPHFQLSFGKSTKKLFSLYKAGKLDGEYVKLG
jgi:peptidoglycan L-alanyl-D-glutamate endopeptidase CwlK